MQRRFIALCVLVLSWSAFAWAQEPDYLSCVPNTAKALLVVKRIQKLDQEVKSLLHSLELDDVLTEPMNSLSGAMKTLFQMTDGLEEQGSILVFMMPESKEDLEDRTVLLVPVRDGDALLKAMGAQGEKDDVWSVSLAGSPSAAAILGDHVVFAEKADTVRAVLDSKASIAEWISEPARAALSGLDVALWLDAEWFLGQFKPEISGMLALLTMAQQAEGVFGMAQSEATQHQVDRLVEGAQSAVLGFNLEAAGLGFRFFLKAKAGSDLQKELLIRNTRDPLLADLPAGAFVFALGQTFSPEAMAKALDAVEPYFQLLGANEEEDKDRMEQLKTVVGELFTLMTGMQVALYTRPADAKGLFGLDAVIENKDSARMMALIEEKFALAKQLVRNENFKEFLDHLTFRKNVLTVGEVPVHAFSYDLSGVEMKKEDLEKVRTALGSDTPALYLAAASKTKLVLGLGGGAERLQSLISQAQGTGSSLAEDSAILSTAAHLPKDRASAAYFSLDHAVTLVKNALKTLEGKDLPVSVGPIHAPFGIASGGGREHLQFDAFLPTPLMKAVRDMIMSSPGPARQIEEKREEF